MLSTEVAKLENVYKDYGNVQALQNVSLPIRTGEVLELLGPNGAGKTTGIRADFIKVDQANVSAMWL